ncbi:MAG: sensor histidine kinase [Elusimicrobiota bacterium]
MLYKFLVDHRDEILALAKRKTSGDPKEAPGVAEGERALPQFYEHLTGELERELKTFPTHSRKNHTRDLPDRRMSPLGYTVAQVVHGYGVLGQAIAELAQARKAPVSPSELYKLNLSVDLAIADAVTERMGYLVHELRNALAAASVAHSMVKKGSSGTTVNALLERNLNRMRDILDHSFSAIRMQHGREVDPRPVLVSEIVEEVQGTASEEARLRGLTLKVAVDSEMVNADRHYLLSALSNLVQNAIKYSKKGGVVWIRSRAEAAKVVIEIEDQCGGLPKGKADELFKPFIQKNSDRSGLGLGLTISRQAAELNGGVLSVRDLPGKGCIFSITLPRLRSPAFDRASNRGYTLDRERNLPARVPSRAPHRRHLRHDGGGGTRL